MMARFGVRLALVGALVAGSLLALLPGARGETVQAAALSQGVGNFDGPWYVGGDLTTPAFIVQAGTTLQIMNEQGRTATANATTSGLTAMWDDGPISGNLSGDQRQIDWANGTFWQRRALISAAFLGGPNIGGIWYVGDTSTQRAFIAQMPGGVLQLMNEQGRSSQGGFNGPNSLLVTGWESGVTATLSPDGNYLDWSNGTHWRR